MRESGVQAIWHSTPRPDRCPCRTIRPECLDRTISLSDAHLRSILREWVAHYNGEHPHRALGTDIPGSSAGSARTSEAEPRRPWTPGVLVRAVRPGRTAPRVLDLGDAGGPEGCCWTSVPMANAGRPEFLRSTRAANLEEQRPRIAPPSFEGVSSSLYS
jgi:hypothetical protein